MTIADHYRSEGARLERKATRERLRRQIRNASKDMLHVSYAIKRALEIELEWQIARQYRYEPRKGGLGRA